ncbi:hypothetical protein JVU11DRAFT_3710 [Chiua virens]|nr:hypothetical protein JVU11DRAFT_3710 [Chiua virens]
MARSAPELACLRAHSRADNVSSTSVPFTSGHVKEREEWDEFGKAMRSTGWFD